MPPRLEPITIPRCAVDRCNRVSSKTLFNSKNAKMASYCDRHADAALKDQREHEERVGFGALPDR